MSDDRSGAGVTAAEPPPRPPSRPTLRDVALQAGVSSKTVSRVLNGEAGVSAATTARIHEIITTLGFRRNDIARQLRMGQSTRTIGLVIEDVGNPFFSGITRAVERSARERGYLVIAGSSEEDPATERGLVRSLLERRVHGLLIVPTAEDHRYLVPEVAMGMAAVFMDRPPGHLDADMVLLDNVCGAYDATAHLIAHGHRRIGMLGDDQQIYTVPQRLQGYRNALAAAGIAYDPALVRLGNHDVQTAQATAEALLAGPAAPTALFASNNRIAVGALRALYNDPRPIAVVGFDDLELAEILATPLTVVSHNPAEMGAEAARLLWRRLDGATGPAERVVLPTRLIPRGSGEIRAA